MRSQSKRPNLVTDRLPMNLEEHSDVHMDRPKKIIYTSKATLNTTAGLAINVLRGKRLVRCRITVQAAPSSAILTGDVLVDGTSAFTTLDSKPRVQVGQTKGEIAYFMGGASVPFDGKVQCQITAVGGATGPAVFEIEYLD